MSRQDITSADNKAIGFDYQFYYFFYVLLDLRHGDKVGFEVKDDVHIDLANGNTVLIQAKHTTQTLKDGNLINLTERDKDLWKTLSNWTKLIAEQNDYSEYLDKTSFQLISNKSISKNPLIIQIKKLLDKEIKTNEFKQYLKNLADNTKDTDIVTHINDLIALKAGVLKDFIKKIEFSLDIDDLIIEIKKRILEKILIKERVEDVYSALHSALRDNNYLTIKSGEKVEISFEEFMNKFKSCIKVGISTKLPIREFTLSMPDYPEKQKFIKQFIDIKDISIDEKELMIEYTTQMLQLFNNLKSWEENGDLLPSDTKKFNKEATLIWKNSFREKYRKIRQKLDDGETLNSIDSEIKETAVKILDEMRKQILTIDETALTLELSNGQFYLLTEGEISDGITIGKIDIENETKWLLI